MWLSVGNDQDWTTEDEEQLGDTVNVTVDESSPTPTMSSMSHDSPEGEGGIKMMHQATGKVIPGSKWFKDAKEKWPMHSGGTRPSTRLIYYKNKGPDGDCIPYRDLEVTAYVKFGERKDNARGEARCIITTGGPGQTKKNCCVYSIGFTEKGKAYCEQEGAHEPKPTIKKMKVEGGEITDIGELYNRTIGLKTVIYHKDGHTYVEGHVDKDANNDWKIFYKAEDPHGEGLPVITKVPMNGDQCQEMRVRCDNIWPVDLIAEKSSIREIVPPA